jgi:hypothetical protein
MIRRATYDDYRRGVRFLCDVILNAITVGEPREVFQPFSPP